MIAEFIFGLRAYVLFRRIVKGGFSQVADNNLKSLISFLRFRFSGFVIPVLVVMAASLSTPAFSQTDFAPGEIMFIGYDSDDPDAFSIVLLTDVVSGTVIYITDRGWSNVSGFRVDNTGEGTISYTFNAAYACGKEIFFTKNLAPNPDIWEARDSNGNLIGTVVTQAGGDPNGPVLGITGDQLFIYQLPTPTAGNQTSFVTAIHMDGPWGTTSNSDDNSAKPNGLQDNEVVVFNAELDNAKYDCDPWVGTGLFLQSAICNQNGAGWLRPDNANNWIESDNYINLNTACNFCCTSTSLSGPDIVSASQVFMITITGTLPPGESWQLYTAGCGVGSPIQTTMSNSFTITAPATEGNITYYVRASGGGDCPGQCVYISICVENTPLATCTNCTANPEVCGDCLMPDIFENPDLDSGCYSIKLIFVLDESGSIGANEPDVRAGVLAFLNALNGQDMEVALIEFSDYGRLVHNYTVINNAYITNIENYFDNIPYPGSGQWYQPGGGTNWHDAMIRVDELDIADMVLFFTDGIPTGFTGINGLVNYCGNGATTQTPEIVNPVKLANKIKSEGTHMFMLGVGAGIDDFNLQLMSGLTEYESGVNTMGTSDYSIGNFIDLAEDLEEFVSELCNSPLVLFKEVFGAVCDGVQQFMFVVHNPGTESAATSVQVIDTFPSGYTNIQYFGSPFVKLCIGPACAAQGQPQPDNAFIWTINSVPPLGYDTLILSVDVLGTGNYTNIAWAQGNNTSLASDTVTSPNFVDDLDPVITCPANISIECSESSLPANTGMATAMDPDGSDPEITYVDITVAGPCPQMYTITRTWTARDGCNNTDDCVQMIEVVDTTPPAMTCPANVTITCTSSTLPDDTGYASATDDCEVGLLVSYADVTAAGSCANEYTITRTWTTMDECGNSAACTQTIIFSDTEAPDITCPANITIGCTDSTLPANTGSATGVDICDPSPVMDYTDATVAGPCPQGYVINRTWFATDDCGNVSSCVQSITLQDIIAPEVTCPANITIECTANTLPANTGSATATDSCDESPLVSYTDVITPSLSCSQELTITRTWMATDDCGNTSTCVQTIVVDDSLAPSVTCPANVTIECTASTLPANTGSATATDNCDSTPLISYSDVTTASPSCTQGYSIVRTWTATDECGNSGTCSQTIQITDSTPPVISCPANVTIECTAVTLPTNTGTATASDNCDSAPAITYTDITTASPSCDEEYTITRTWLATDECGNTSTCNQIITIDDSTAPGITCPVNVTIECTASTLPDSTGTATGMDNCDPSPEVSYTDVTVSGGCPQAYTINRTWQLTDNCGNSSTCVQVLTIIDSTPPDITCPADVTIECTASTLPANTGNATATDNCDPAPTIMYADVTSGTPCAQEYQITRTWTATDACGNSTTCIQSITIEDSVAPEITCPADITIECTASTLPANTGSPVVTDNCDSAPVVDYSDVTLGSPGCPQEYTITRTWSATDACGNVSTCVQVIVVDDSTPPVITCPANVTIECTAVTLPANTGMATATDNCDLSPVVTYSDVTTSSPACPQAYSIARTWTATDTCGNSSTCVQTISIVDTTPPDITCPADMTIECIESTLPANTGSAIAVDNCDPAPEITYADITTEGPFPNGFTIERTWTASDSCGNTSSCVQHIEVFNLLEPGILGNPYDTICSGSSVAFEAVDQGINPTFYQWSFGSGSNPSMASGIGPHNVVYTYNGVNGTTGAWVILTVSSPGCPPVTDTVANVHVNAKPNSAITSSPGSPCVLGPKTFQPTAAMVPGFTYSWNFGVGASPPTAMGYGPHTIEYFSSGSKTVKLVVHSNEQGASCADSSTVTFTVNVCPGNITGKVMKSDGTPIASVNVRLYADQNLDGIQDNSTIIRSVFTNASGVYSMATITPGYYVIVQTQPAGFFSLYDEDTSEDFDSLSNLIPNDNIIPVTVEPNELDADNIFVEVSSPGIISGYVFEDFDGNQAPIPIEGIPGVTIKLFTDNDQNGIADPGGLVATTTTSSIGYYTFGGLNTGDYVIVEVQPAGYTNVKDFDASNDGDNVPNTNMTNDTIPVTISNAETDADNYFIELSPCSKVVTNLNDGDPGSLRYMVDCAGNGDTITFHPLLLNQTIHLDEGRLEINKDLFIHSSLTPKLMIQSDVNGMIKVFSGKAVQFKNLNLTSGLSGFPGAAIDNYGLLTLWDVFIYRNPLLPATDYLLFNGNPGQVTVKGSVRIEPD